MTGFPTLTHIALTVQDLSVSRPWYRALIGSDAVVDEHTGAGFHHVVFALDGGTLLGLHQHDQPAGGGSFSERGLGLDHVSFGVASRDELEKWVTRLDELGITHGGIVDADYGSGLSFRDPDNLALEFFAPPAG